MTESKLHASNTHLDRIPAHEQLVPQTEENDEVSKKTEKLTTKSSGEKIRHITTIVLALFTSIALLYPVLILPGTVIIILPIEVILMDHIHRETNQLRNALNIHHYNVLVTERTRSEMDKDQVRVSVYSEKAPP